MTTHITCDLFADALDRLLDRELSESERVAMEAHAAACGDCGPLLSDLRRLTAEAAALPELAPGRDLWAGIAARIETPVVDLTSKTGSHDAVHLRRRGWTRHVVRGLAAAGLVAVTATITHELTKRSVAATVASSTVASATSATPRDSVAALPAAPANPSAPVDPTSSRSAGTRAVARPGRATLASNRSKTSAQQTYDREIATLRAVLAYRRKDLDSATVAVVDKNLQIIDDAIAQCQQALKKDPQSRFLLESLNDALDNKVQLLRTAASLPSRS